MDSLAVGGQVVDLSSDVRAFIIALVTSGGMGIVTGWASYVWGRKAKVDEVRITKSHELIQSIAVCFQKVHQSNVGLAEWFRSNFELLGSTKAGVARLREFAGGLYADHAAEIKTLEQERGALQELLLQARVYLPKGVTDDLGAYLHSCRFEWSEVVLFNTYLEGLFENLLDAKASKRRSELATGILQGLRRAGT